MTIYNFNLGIGWASSGVEYAQAYRANIFRKNKQKAKFIFMDMFHENIEPMIQNIGFEDDEVIWFYQSFTDIPTSPNSYTVRQLESTFSGEPTDKKVTEKEITYTFKEQKMRLTVSLDRNNPEAIYKTEVVVAGCLIQRDYYTYTRVYSEYFKPFKHESRLYLRRFFNENGSIAYEEVLNGKQSLFVFEDRTIYSKENLIIYFMERLELKKEDMIILDRSTGIGPQILKGKGEAKIGVVIHAEHFNETMSNKNNILWNNFYDFQLKNYKSMNFFVTATKDQKDMLHKQFKQYGFGDINIFDIPVGSIDQLKYLKRRKKNTLITASRLASEKHIDWLICAVAKCKKQIPDITLDIYGKGGEEAKLKTLITSLNAEEYITLKGQQQLEDIYKTYTTYVSASTSEGFGLTLLEAVGSGLGMVGFDVRYGNQAFIKDGKNGYRVVYKKNAKEENILKLSDAIIKLQKEEEKNLSEVQQVSYEIANRFLTKYVQQKWLYLEKRLKDDESI